MRGIAGAAALLAIGVLTGLVSPSAFEALHAQDFDVDVTEDLARQRRTRAPQETPPSRDANYYDGEWTGSFKCAVRELARFTISAVDRTTVAVFGDGTWQREAGIKGRIRFETYRITIGADGKARMKGHWVRGRTRPIQEPISLRGNAFADPENPGVEVLELAGTRAGAKCTMRLTRVAGTASDAEQAREVGVFIQGQAFVAPPRTVSDIAALLERAPTRDMPRREQDRALVEEDPPETQNRTDLVTFYLKRGEAAGRLGDSRRELADLRLAETLSRDSPDRVRDNVLFPLARAERSGGSVKDAIRYYAERVGYARNGVTVSAGCLTPPSLRWTTATLTAPPRDSPQRAVFWSNFLAIRQRGRK